MPKRKSVQGFDSKSVEGSLYFAKCSPWSLVRPVGVATWPQWSASDTVELYHAIFSAPVGRELSGAPSDIERGFHC